MNSSNVCKNLRNKAMYIPALAHAAEQGTDSSTGHSHHCWCNCTLTETGPDDRPVHPEHCRSHRACFEE